MSKRDGHQQGAQRHAEGEHGEKTHEAIISELEKNKRGPKEASNPQGASDANVYGIPQPGKHRIDEDRQQHDPAELGHELSEQEKKRQR